MKKYVFELLTLAAASPARRRHGRQKVLIPECDLTGRRVMVEPLLKRACQVALRDRQVLSGMAFFFFTFKKSTQSSYRIPTGSATA